MDFMMQALVRPKKNSRYFGDFETLTLTVVVRCDGERNVAAVYREVLALDCMEESKVLNAGLFHAEKMQDAVLRGRVLAALGSHGCVALISIPAGAGFQFSRN
jgi:hypothetical protein